MIRLGLAPVHATETRIDKWGGVCYSVRAKNQLRIVSYVRDVGYLGSARIDRGCPQNRAAQVF